MHEFRPAHVVDEDAALARALQAGHESAVRTLFDRYGGQVYGALRWSLAHGDGVATATVEVFLFAWRQADRFEPGREFAPWLATISRRVAGLHTSPAPDATDFDALWVLRGAVDELPHAERDAAREHYLGAAEQVDAADLERVTRRLENRLASLRAEVNARSMERLLGDDALWVAPPEGLVERTVAAIESEAVTFESPAATPSPASSRPWRSALLGAIAALVVLVGLIVVLSALNSSDDGDGVTLDLISTGLVADVAATVDVSDEDQGVRLHLEAAGLPRRADGAYYEVWLGVRGGAIVSAGTFQDGVDVVLAGGVALADVESVTITRGSTAAGAPSDQVVLKGDLP